MEIDQTLEDLIQSAHLVARAGAELEIAATYGEIHILRRLVDQLHLACIDNFREHGLSYNQIAAPLGVTRQNVYQKHAALRDHLTPQ